LTLEPPVRRLLSIPNLRIYLLGDLISTAGDNALWLAMAIWMKELTGSSAWAGLILFFFALGNLFSPLGGLVADRFRRRPLLICGNLFMAALVLLILLVHGRDLMWLVYLVMFAYGVVGSAMGPAETALLPAIVPEDLLAEANGAQQSLSEGLRLVTPLLGAGLFVWAGAGVVAVVDAATFLVAAASLAALRVTAPAPGTVAVTATPGAPEAVPEAWEAVPVPGTEAVPELVAEKVPGKGETSAGFRFLAADPILKSITITLGLVLLALGFTESAAFSVVTVGLHRSASFVGVLSTVQGVGAITGGILAAPLLKRTSASLLIVAGLVSLTVSMVLLAVPNLAVDLVAMLAAGLVGPWLLVAATTALQTRTPGYLLGRVTGVFQLSLGLPQIASIGLGAALIAVVNYRILLLTIAVVAVLAAGYLLSVPETRRRTVPANTVPANTVPANTGSASTGPASTAPLGAFAAAPAETISPEVF
jgi:MFS family permease